MKKMILITTLATLLFGGSVLAFGQRFDSNQTKTGASQQQTAAAKKEAEQKRLEAKKEAEQKRREAKLAAKNSDKTTKKKRKKFLGIF